MKPSGGGSNTISSLHEGFSIPSHDLGEVLETIGIKLFVRERTLAQYVFWSVRTQLIAFLDQHGASTIAQIVEGTSLTAIGADSLLGVLCALGFVSRAPSGEYELSALAQDYLVERSPFYIADQLEATGFPIPRPYLCGRSSLITALKLRILGMTSTIRYGSGSRLANQHARNLGACAAAVRTGEFKDVKQMLDLAGGSGTFSIPLALDYPQMRIVLADLPESLRDVRQMLATHGLDQQIQLRGIDALHAPWRLPENDGIFIGNFLHAFDDTVCINVLKEAHCRLSLGGKIWVHEMLWYENRDGPLITALWHAAMRSAGPGRQRTGSELSRLLAAAGFSDMRVIPTSGAYAMVVGRKNPR